MGSFKMFDFSKIVEFFCLNIYPSNILFGVPNVLGEFILILFLKLKFNY